MDVDLLALRRHNVVWILVAIRNPNLFETREVKADGFLLLKGYSFRFSKEGTDYVAEPDFVPFIWKRNEKDDDAKGMEEKDSEGNHRLNLPRLRMETLICPKLMFRGPVLYHLGC